MGRQVSLVRIALASVMVLVLSNSASASATDWKAMSFDAFVVGHSDAKGKELAGQYHAAGVKMLSFMVGQGAYRDNWKDPVELYLQDFKEWCVAHDGVFAHFPSMLVAGGVPPVSEDMNRAAHLLAQDLGVRFKELKPGHNLIWYECRGPGSAAIIRYRLNQMQHPLPGDQQRTALFLYSLNEWNALLATYVQKEKDRKDAVRAEYQEEQKFRQEISAERYKRTKALRANPKVGAETTKGIIVEIKPPLVLIQHSNVQPAWTEWVKLDRIESY